MNNQTVRLIAGKYRGRKIVFPDSTGLRPTPDRVRETLFNWLQQAVVGATCLDLFAGSGALGFEAASRGAANVVLLDADTSVVQALKASAEQLKADMVNIQQARFPNLPELPTMDIVFIDPPFQQHLAQAAIDYLNQHQVLTPNALVYCETEAKLELLVPTHWECIKEKTAGAVLYRLFRVDVTAP